MGPCAGGNRPQNPPVQSQPVEGKPEDHHNPPIQPENPNHAENREQPYLDNHHQEEKPPERKEEAPVEAPPQENHNQYPNLDRQPENRVSEEKPQIREDNSPDNKRKDTPYREDLGLSAQDPKIVVYDKNEEEPERYKRDVEGQGAFDNIEARSSEKPKIRGQVQRQDSQIVPDEPVLDFRNSAHPVNFAITVG